jgi:nitroreductase
MALMDVIKKRKSVRKYLDKPVPRNHVRTCIEAARLAPSAENIQPWRFIVIDDPEYKMKFCDQVCSGVYRPSLFIRNAPAIVVILAKYTLITDVLGRGIQGTNYYLLDIGISGEHLVLQAQELGIGTCWIGWFNQKKAKKFLKLGPQYRVVSLIAMGYPAEGGTKNKPDMPLDQILFFNREVEQKL